MAHPDLNALAGALVPMAKKLLEEQGGFLPFGGVVQVSGEVVHLSGVSDGKALKADAIIETYELNLHDLARSGSIRASALVIDAKVTRPGEQNPSDVICVRLEHATGEALEIFVPYCVVTRSCVEYRPLFAARGRRTVFVPDEADL